MTSGVFFINMHSCASNINRPICASCSKQLKLNWGGCNIYMVMCTADLPHNADLLPPPVMQTSRLPRSVCSSQFQQLDDALRLSPPHPPHSQSKIFRFQPSSISFQRFVGICLWSQQHVGEKWTASSKIYLSWPARSPVTTEQLNQKCVW